MTTWIIFFALALLSIVVFVFALRSQQDAEALEDRLAGTILMKKRLRIRIRRAASSRCRNGFSRLLALG